MLSLRHTSTPNTSQPGTLDILEPPTHLVICQREILRFNDQTRLIVEYFHRDTTIYYRLILVDRYYILRPMEQNWMTGSYQAMSLIRRAREEDKLFVFFLLVERRCHLQDVPCTVMITNHVVLCDHEAENHWTTQYFLLNTYLGT